MRPPVESAFPPLGEPIGYFVQNGQEMPVYARDTFRRPIEQIWQRTGGADDDVRENELDAVDDRAELSALQELIENQAAVISSLQDQLENLSQSLLSEVEAAVNQAVGSLDFDKSEIEGAISDLQRVIAETDQSGAEDLQDVLRAVVDQAANAERLAEQALASLTPESIVAEASGLIVVPQRLVVAGAGLTGGGSLENDVTVNVGAGTGITANANDVALSNTAVTPASYGSATEVAQITIDQQGRITAATDVAISFPVSSVAGKTGTVTLASSDLTDSSNIPLLNAAQDFTAKQTFSGNIQVGTHSAIGAETVTGFISIEDSGGTIRKIAVVS